MEKYEMRLKKERTKDNYKSRNKIKRKHGKKLLWENCRNQYIGLYYKYNSAETLEKELNIGKANDKAYVDRREAGVVP